MSNVNVTPKPDLKPYRNPSGFRFSRRDGIVLALSPVITIAIVPLVGHFSWLFPFVLGHFFLFCNVFRVPRNAELFWAGTFLLNALVLFRVLDPSVARLMLAQLPISLVVLIFAVTRKTYHGVLSNRLRPAQPS